MNDVAPGEYRCIANVYAASKSKMSTNAAGGTINIMGGLAYLSTLEGSVGAGNVPQDTLCDSVPLDARRGNTWPGISTNVVNTPYLISHTGEPLITILCPYTNVINAVIPMTAPGTTSTPIAVPANGSLTNSTPVYVYTYVQDPLVNKFPGDWGANVTVSTTAPTTTMPWQYSDTGNPDTSYCSIYTESATTQANFTDPDAFWLPTLDNRASGSTGEVPQIPRTARFPSSGYLQYLRTGIIPDDETQAYNLQHGTPFRLLDFSPSYTYSGHSQKTSLSSSQSYPDWAMLDLFYSPSSLLSYGSPYEVYAGTRTATPTQWSANPWYPVTLSYSNSNTVQNMFQYGTYGGATSGRINPNGSVIYTTNANIPTPNLTRTVPLQALLHGLVVNQTQTGNYVTTSGNDFHSPQLTAGTPVDETNVASAIATYLTTNSYGHGGSGPAPFRLPGEICNVPAVAALGASVNPTRNDLVRQIIGNLTTQSNTFSIWVAAQSIIKGKGNSNNGIYEAGDQITANVRYHYIVERDLNPGTDGVYGNSASPGPDGIVGTPDDPAGAGANPNMPSYVYRIIYAEEIR